MSVGRKMLNQVYVHILGLLHVMQWNSILLGPWPDCMGSEESQLSSVLDRAITTYVQPENISANWQVESVFLLEKNVSFLEALPQGIIVTKGTGSGYLIGLNKI